MRPYHTLITTLLAAMTAISLSARPVLAASDVAVLEQRSDMLGELGVRVGRYKKLDTATGVVSDVAVNEATGAPVDYSELRAQAMQAQRVRLGALDPAFEPALRAALAGTMLRADVLTVAGGPSGAALRSLLVGMGARVRKVDGQLATIEAGAAFLSRLARDPRIDAIARAQPKRTTSMNAAKELVEDKLFFPHALGLGTSLRIGILEPNACIRRTHQDFRFVQWDERIGGNQCDVTFGGHSTAVAGVLSAIRSVNGQWQYAGLFGGHLFEGDFTSSMVSRNPNIINMSATHSPIEVSGIDAAVWDKRILFLLGSANSDTGVDRATCDSYNALCIGGYGPNQTYGPNAFGDDVHADSAMWQNPVSGRERPDLVGPMGVTTATWSRNDAYEGWGGTSFATPAVSGLAGLLIASHQAQLDRQPTLMRALLVASAITHPVYDGDSTRLPIIGDSYDDRAGAGVPRGDVADAILNAGQYHAKHVVKSTDFPGNKYAQTFSFTANAGQRVRVALSWDNCPVNPLSFPNQDALIADLDLTVRGPNVPLSSTLGGFATGGVLATAAAAPAPAPSPSAGLLAGSLAAGTSMRMLSMPSAMSLGTVSLPGDSTSTGIAPRINLATVPFVASNISHVDNYETVEFVAPVQGQYRVEVTAPRWDLCPHSNGFDTNLALAWAMK